MPNTATHYIYGQLVLRQLHPLLRKFILEHKSMYDLGLQGPDIFFYYQPYRRSDVAAYGSSRHDESGRRVFEPVLGAVHNDDAASAYLLGNACHYMLDSRCHPYVYEHCPDFSSHMRMEAALETQFMRRYYMGGDRRVLLPAKGLDYASMAKVWPEQSPQIIKKCVRRMRFYTALIDRAGFLVPTEAKRDRLPASLLLPRDVPRAQSEHVKRLNECFFGSVIDCVFLMRDLVDAIGREPYRLEKGFERNYQGTLHLSRVK
ncbi:MAG: zinc dependent phospholipase C family protein [Christensenellales bacterium]|jgi:hypothetical protein